MTHEFVEHTGEVELAIAATGEADVYGEAVCALGELVGNGRGRPETRMIEVAGADRGLLLVELVTELLFLLEVERFVPERAVAIELDDDRLRVRVEGRVGRPLHLVKAATLNDLEFRRRGDAWVARLVLDV